MNTIQPVHDIFNINKNFTYFRYLALVAALACEAHFVFVPEYPHKEGWEDKLCKKLQTVGLYI